ncbi:flagellar export protein FliJ [Thiolapillus sp.]
MKSGASLTTVARVVRNKEREMARQMSECRLTMEKEEQQLSLLMQYRAQYLQGSHAAGGGGISPAQLQDYRLFLSRLDQAIGQQQQLVEESRRSFSQLQAQWLKLHGEHKAMQKLIVKRRQCEREEQARGEQKELDERVGWTFRQRGPL